MGLKSIDMQMAISRIDDASRMQEQFNKQGQRSQEMLLQQQLQKDRIKSQQVLRYEHVEKRNIHDNHHIDKQPLFERANKRGDDQVVNRTHPYLGKTIDMKR